MRHLSNAIRIGFIAGALALKILRKQYGLFGLVLTAMVADIAGGIIGDIIAG